MTVQQSPGRWNKKRKKRKEKALQQKESYRKTARLRLQAMLKAGLGSKRSKDKAEADTKNKIYSKATFETYKQQFRHFADWLDKAHPEAFTLEDARGFVDEYLRHLIELERSAYSISTAKAAIAKVMGVEATQFIATPPRLRVDIKRSRGVAERDKHISDKKEEELARFTSATGLRRKEMTMIRAEDLFFENGQAYLNVDKGTKGGKSRVAKIVGKTEAETKEIVKWIQSKEGRLFNKLSSNYDNHFYRATYANRLYNQLKRDIADIPTEEKYIMRKDRAGEVYDKQAMLHVSKALGHNRISVIAQSYLYQN
jgi:Phage integrase family./Phage integrase, N-terminal SAM-like domain.